MKIKSEAAFETRTYGVEVGDQEGILQFGDAWEGMGVSARAKALGKMADLLTVSYLQSEGVISAEYAATRAASIKAR